MTPMIKTLTGAGAGALLMLALPAAGQEFSAPQKSEIERIIRDYLVSHPEVLQEAIGELDKRQAAADVEKAKTAVANNAETLFNSSRHVVLGNPKGDPRKGRIQFAKTCMQCHTLFDVGGHVGASAAMAVFVRPPTSPFCVVLSFGLRIGKSVPIFVQTLG